MNELRVECLRSLLHRPLAYFDRQSTSPPACALLLSQQPPMAMSVRYNHLTNVLHLNKCHTTQMIDNRLSIVVDGLFACITNIVLTYVVCFPVGIVSSSFFSARLSQLEFFFLEISSGFPIVLMIIIDLIIRTR